MSGTIRFKLGELLGVSPECAFFDEDERMALAEGKLSAERLEQWRAHARGCASCLELTDDLELFTALAARGLLPTETRAFEARDTRARQVLGLGDAGRKVSRRPSFVMGWLLPALVFTSLMGVIFWPSQPNLVADVETFPFAAPPAVRGATAGEYWKRAEAAWRAGDWGTAETVLGEAVAAFDDQADFAFYLGAARLQSGHWHGAADALERAVELQGEYPSEMTRWALATALDRARRDDEACEVLRSIAGMDGARADAARQAIDRGCR